MKKKKKSMDGMLESRPKKIKHNLQTYSVYGKIFQIA